MSSPFHMLQTSTSAHSSTCREQIIFRLSSFLRIYFQFRLRLATSDALENDRTVFSTKNAAALILFALELFIVDVSRLGTERENPQYKPHRHCHSFPSHRHRTAISKIFTKMRFYLCILRALSYHNGNGSDSHFFFSFLFPHEFVAVVMKSRALAHWNGTDYYYYTSEL